MFKKDQIWRDLIVVLFATLGGVVWANSTLKAGTTPVPSRHPIWVLFNDKGPAEAEYYRGVFNPVQLTERARNRRLWRGTRGIIDYIDLDVPPEYISQIQALGVPVRTVSRWFNAISVMATDDEESVIGALPMVKKTKRVIRVSRRFLKNVERGDINPNDVNVAFENYGASYGQLDQINAIAAHADGYTGSGIWVLMLDTGYLTDHLVFQANRIVGQYDFIQDDSITNNQEGDTANQEEHGTATASIVGGNDPGIFMGVAFDCSFLMAKTEIVDQEIQIEEDYYVAGLEWGEALGADVVSSSLGYIDWYTFEQMDGHTALTTQAMDIAASLGMVCVTAAGNEGGTDWGHIIAPADADSVISVGAVNSEDIIAGFSSPGPTADGRLKPEVVARGVYTYAAGSSTTSAFIHASGTSLSTPLVAGASALVLQAHPTWTPMMVREALMAMADNAESPDNNYGFGLIDVMAAINYNFDIDTGDLTQDGQINIGDVVLMVNWILSGMNLLPSQIERADINLDGLVNVLDAVQLVNLILTY